jgi:hypothetical protein
MSCQTNNLIEAEKIFIVVGFSKANIYVSITSSYPFTAGSFGPASAIPSFLPTQYIVQF